MAFVIELIPETEKAKFTFKVNTGPNGSQITLWKWSIDRDRDAFLVHVNTSGGAYEGTQETQHYTLSWKGDLIHFSGDPRLSADGRIMTWRIHRLVIPVSLSEQRHEVLQIITDGLDAMGFLYKRSRVDRVDVHFGSSDGTSTF